MIIIIPITSVTAAQNHIDTNNLEFESRVWRKGIPDPPITDWGHAIKCYNNSLAARAARAVTGNDPVVSHLMLWGDLTTEQARGITNNVSGAKVYAEPQYTRRSAMADAKIALYTIEEPEQDHLMPMPIMHKVWDMADAPWNPRNIAAASDKWDGYTCTLKYDAGSLVVGLTQNTGVRGNDRTERLATMVPETLNRPATMQVEGEVITNTNTPRKAYYAMHGATDREFAALGCKFLAFDVRFANNPFTTWSDAMAWLDSQGFDTVLNHVDPDYPKDGIVYRIDNNDDFEAADIGMFALKYDETG